MFAYLYIKLENGQWFMSLSRALIMTESEAYYLNEGLKPGHQLIKHTKENVERRNIQGNDTFKV